MSFHAHPPFTTEFAHCTVCDKQVDSIVIDMPSAHVDGWDGSVLTYTGEIIMTVKCHGETWKMSNFRGQLL